MNDPRASRDSVWSVGRQWLPWCLGLIFALTIGWVVFIARFETASGKHDGIAETTIAVVGGSAAAVPLIVVCAIFVVTALDIAGGAIMVTYRYLERKFLKPLEERLLAEARAAAIAEGKAVGMAVGKAMGMAEGAESMRLMWEDWNRRREEAATQGKLFNEPPPGS